MSCCIAAPTILMIPFPSLLMTLQKKHEIYKDKQILMISRFYKPAFSTIIIFFGHIINEKEERMQEKFCLTF